MTPATVEQLAASIPDGSMVALPSDMSGVSMSLTRALVRRGVRGLHLVCLPTSGMQADLLIGAGCVGTVETSGITLGEFGSARRFQAALKSGEVRVLDATCPAVHAGFRAAAAGLPFMAMRGLLGTDLLANRPDWQVIDNPFAQEKDPLVLLPAIRPEFAMFHAPYADRNGNVFIGARREFLVMAQAANRTLVTVEEIRDIDLLAREETAAGCLAAAYGAEVAIAKRGAWPLALWDLYEADAAHLKLYTEMSRSEADFQSYLDKHVFSPEMGPS
ncbi:CoA synthetase [Ramlibacter sp. WS9]|nr:CoA synthetase [Ramlibacter sp. WS9]